MTRQKLDILVIEDSPADFLLIKRELQKYEPPAHLLRVETPDSLSRALDTNCWQLILSDYRVPQLNFEKTLAHCQSVLPDIPVILVSGTVGEEKAVELLKLGVWDFVLKDNLSRLRPSIDRSLREADERRARRAAEKALQHHAERLKLALSAARMGVWEWDVANDRFYRSEECLQIMGSLPCQGGLNDCLLRLAPTDGTQFKTVVERAVADQSHFQTEFRIARSDGEERWIASSGQVYDNDGDRSAYLVGTFQDITERKRIEEDQRIASVVFEASDGMIVTDSEGYTLRINTAFSRMTAFTGEDMIGRKPGDVLATEKNSPDFQRSMWRLLEQQGYWHGEIWNRKKNGEDVLFVTSITAVHDEAGNVAYYVGIYRDITEVRKQQEMLLQAQKMEAIGQLTGGLAHDFNNLLGIVIGNLDLLELLLADPEQQQLLTTAQAAALRGAEISKALLAVARRRSLTVSTINIGTLVRDLLPLIRNSVGARINVQQVIADDNVTAAVDVSSLESAVLNLVINARDAMPDGGRLLVSVTCARISADSDLDLAPGDYVVVDVSDSGCGMPEAVRLRVTEPFFTTKERGRGTGLGLAIVSGFAKQSGGGLHIYSEEGKGSSIRIYLPATQSEQAVTAQTEDTVPHGSERILIVDDEADLLALAKKWLEALGYRIATETVPTKAIEKIRAETYDLLLTDIVMPGKLDGLALAAEAKAICPEIRLLLSSGFAEQMVEQPDDMHAPLLQKPYRKTDLAQAVRNALDTDL